MSVAACKPSFVIFNFTSINMRTPSTQTWLFIVAVLTLLSGRELPAESNSQNVEHVFVEPARMNAQVDKIVLALSLISDGTLLTDRTHVILRKQTSSVTVIEFSGVLNEAGKIGNPYATVEFDGQSVAIKRKTDLGAINRAPLVSPECNAVTSAAIFLQSVGRLPESFIVEVKQRPEREVAVTFYTMPRAPGRFSVVVASPVSLRYYPGK